MAGADDFEKQTHLAFPNGLKSKKKAFTTEQKEDGGHFGVRRPANDSAFQEKPQSQIAEVAVAEKTGGHGASAVRRQKRYPRFAGRSNLSAKLAQLLENDSAVTSVRWRLRLDERINSCGRRNEAVVGGHCRK